MTRLLGNLTMLTMVIRTIIAIIYHIDFSNFGDQINEVS
jgi:hypothetical protein